MVSSEEEGLNRINWIRSILEPVFSFIDSRVTVMPVRVTFTLDDKQATNLS